MHLVLLFRHQFPVMTHELQRTRLGGDNILATTLDQLLTLPQIGLVHASIINIWTRIIIVTARELQRTRLQDFNVFATASDQHFALSQVVLVHASIINIWTRKRIVVAAFEL